VIYPDIATRVNLEPELGVVMSAQTSRVSVKQAESHVLGYTVVNDVTAFGTTKEVNFAPLYGKSFDTFGILGPRIVPGLDPTDQTIRAAVNGEEFLVISTALMTWNAYEIVSWVSQVMTLFPGDVIAMGAPPGFDAKNINPGDRMTVTIDAIGSIENPVARRA
jgi:5-oxopent-3-ene-1,2,5-tricarboxylate decarboxylase / 2-hydroxyhepta-2,4-diene-1,7-dioate isomerase